MNIVLQCGGRLDPKKWGPDGGSDSTGAESDPRSLKCNTVRNICEATSSHARCKNAEIPASWICEI